METESTAADLPPKQGSKSTIRNWSLLGIIIFIVTYGICVAFDFSPIEWLSGPTKAEEMAARKQLEALGGLTVLDAQQRHVATANLTTIDAADNFRKALPILSSFPRMQVLELSGTSVLDDDLEVVGRLHRLTSLHLNDTSIGDRGLGKIRGLRRLESLHLGNTDISTSALEMLRGMGSVRVLDLSGTKTTEALGELSSLKRLDWLVLQGHDLNESQIRTIAEFPGISRLTIGEQVIDGKTRDKILRDHPNLSIE